jgi:nitrogen fixation/metabolism regulation signal transduction histidine kinase
VGLIASRNLDALLTRIGKTAGVELSLEAPPPSPDRLQRTLTLPPQEGVALSITASRSRRELFSAVEQLDLTVLLIGSATLASALLITVLLSRGLARPVRALAEQAQRVIHGDPQPVVATGARELVEAAEAFNRAIADLVALRKRLAVTERIAARREIARRVAHEIKNPLLPIRASVETLRRLRARQDPAFDEYFDEATRTVLEEVHRITNIVSEFTKFQRLPAPNIEPMDLVAAAKKVVALHAADPDGVRTDGGGPPRVELEAEAIPEVRADKDQIVQVLTNLIQNGLEAAAAVRSDPRVLVTVKAVPDERVRIVVRDNGPGVSEEMRERLFEPYATSKATGTGLGLAICQRIVFEHGGEIAYRPATKGGAVFEITLPIHGPSLLERPLETTAQPVSRHMDATPSGAAKDDPDADR